MQINQPFQAHLNIITLAAEAMTRILDSVVIQAGIVEETERRLGRPVSDDPLNDVTFREVECRVTQEVLQEAINQAQGFYQDEEDSAVGKQVN